MSSHLPHVEFHHVSCLFLELGWAGGHDDRWEELVEAELVTIWGPQDGPRRRRRHAEHEEALIGLQPLAVLPLLSKLVLYFPLPNPNFVDFLRLASLGRSPRAP